MQNLEDLRTELSQLDVELLEMVARRQQLVAEIGRVKSKAGQGTRDYARERVVLELARCTARRVGVDEEIAEELFQLLIRASLAAQEQDKVATFGVGSGKRVLVIGGAGRMGQWFLRYLTSQGYEAEVLDPGGAVAGYASYGSLEQTRLEHDLIVLATPIGVTSKVMQELAWRRPGGVIFDISSLKGPLKQGLDALRESGCRVTSIHPMFGPDTELLSGRNVVFVDVGVPDATEAARQLFLPTMADLVDMSLEAHDRAMAYVLGLSHAVNIAFFNALAESGEDVPALARLSSSTFDAQLEVASHVARENPYLYFEVQSLNAHSPRALVALLGAVTRVAGRVLDGDEKGFIELMAQGKAFLDGRSGGRRLMRGEGEHDI